MELEQKASGFNESEEPDSEAGFISCPEETDAAHPLMKRTVYRPSSPDRCEHHEASFKAIRAASLSRAELFGAFGRKQEVSVATVQ